MFREYDEIDGLGLAELIRSREVSSAEAVAEMRSPAASHDILDRGRFSSNAPEASPTIDRNASI